MSLSQGYAGASSAIAESGVRRKRTYGLALAALTALSAGLSAWGIEHRRTHDYYSAAVRSMSDSWNGFVYGALDPSSSITVDKIPGALWPQALSVRVFGFHGWAMAIPEVLSAAATVLLLFRVVRRWAGPDAGLFAAAAYATTPVVVVLARTTIPDTLLVFFLVFAAERFWVALESDRRRDLVLSGALIGIAFNVKMLQALLVVPVFGIVYWLWGPRDLRRKVVGMLSAGGALTVAAVAWIAVVELTPASSRPYVAGTANNSAVDLVVRYDGLDRFRSSVQRLPFGGLAGPTRLFNEQVGPQIGWLLPVALLALGIGVYRSRLRERLGAGYAFWGLWLAIHAIAFSGASYGIHPYYTVALAPAIAALVGVTLADSDVRAQTLALIVAMTGAVLLTIRADYLEWAPVLAGILAVLAVLGMWWRADSRARYLLALAVLIVPAIWSIDSLRQQQTFAGAINPVAGPRAGGLSGADPVAGPSDLRQLASYLLAHRGSRYVAATTDALTAAPLISMFDLRILPLGGLSGSDPTPEASVLERLTRSGAVGLVVYRSPAPTATATARSRWLRAHCRAHPAPELAALARMHARLLDCG